MPSAPSVASAALLGAAGGMRTFVPPAALAISGRMARGRGRYVLLAAALGEMVQDKVPGVPARVGPPGLAARVVASGVAGNQIAGRRGAAAAATTAAVSALGTWSGRGALVDATGVPDPALAVGEDILALTIAGLAVRTAPESESTAPAAEPERDTGTLATVKAIARGVGAAAVGTAAMTGAQLAYYKATGAKQSRAPEQVAARILKQAFGVKVPRRRRQQLNWASHVGYGISWGVPLGLIAGRRPKALSTGTAFGGAVWLAGLVELPALGQAPPVWEMELEHVALDAGFHLVYGLAAGAALKALS